MVDDEAVVVDEVEDLNNVLFRRKQQFLNRRSKNPRKHIDNNKQHKGVRDNITMRVSNTAIHKRDFRFLVACGTFSTGLTFLQVRWGRTNNTPRCSWVRVGRVLLRGNKKRVLDARLAHRRPSQEEDYVRTYVLVTRNNNNALIY